MLNALIEKIKRDTIVQPLDLPVANTPENIAANASRFKEWRTLARKEEKTYEEMKRMDELWKSIEASAVGV